MADRITGKPIRLIADLGTGFSSATVTVTDAFDNTVDTESVTEIAEGRGIVTVTPSASLVLEGVWKATWSTGKVQEFTVGQRYFETCYDTLVTLLDRIDDSYIGTVTDNADSSLTDDAVLGGEGDFVGCWVTPDHTTQNIGLFRRVMNFNGSTFTLNAPFVAEMAAAEEYLVSVTHPRVARKAINSVIEGFADLGRVKVIAKDVAVDANGVIEIPNGWSHIYQITMHPEDDGSEDTFEEPELLGNADWRFLPGRRILAAGYDDTYTATLEGVRQARAPLWDDSYLDIDPVPVVAMAAAHLHNTRAGGQATDPDDHLRRSVAAFQEAVGMFSLRSGRAVHNMRRIIE